MKTLITLLFAAVLVGCAASPTVPQPRTAAKQTVQIPGRLLIECEELPALTRPQYTQKEIIEEIDTWITIVDDCRSRAHELVNIVRDAFNIDTK